MKHSLKKSMWMGGVMLFGMTVLHGGAWAARDYEVTGTVSALNPGTLVVTRGDEVFEFDRKSLDKKTSSHIKVGDEVTVHYRLQLNGVKKHGPSQQPGQLAPGIPGHVDDRAFYSS